jgi:hypothetical protein
MKLNYSCKIFLFIEAPSESPPSVGGETFEVITVLKSSPPTGGRI